MSWAPAGGYYDGREALDRFEALAAGSALHLSDEPGGCFFAGSESNLSGNATIDEVLEVEATPADTTTTIAAGKAGSGADLFPWDDARTLKFLELLCIPKESTEPFPSTEETNDAQAVRERGIGCR